MPNKVLTAKQVADTAEKRAALGLVDGVDARITHTQLMFNVGAEERGIFYPISQRIRRRRESGRFIDEPYYDNNIADSFNIDWIVRGTLDAMNLVDDAIPITTKEYAVAGSNAIWLGSFNVAGGENYLQGRLQRAVDPAAIPPDDPTKSIVFLACLSDDDGNQHYEYCELKPNSPPDGQWQLIVCNSNSKARDNNDYPTDGTGASADLNRIIGEVQGAGFDLSNVTSKCVFEQASPNGSGVAAVETVIERLVRAPNTPIHQRPYVEMKAKVRNDLPNSPEAEISMEERLRMRHAAIAVAMGEKHPPLKADMQARRPVAPVYLACFDSADDDAVATAQKLPTHQTMKPFYDAQIIALKEIKSLTPASIAHAAELKIADFRWNLRTNGNTIKTKLEKELSEKLKNHTTVDEQTPEKYAVKTNGKSIMEITQHSVAAPANWKEAVTEGADPEKIAQMAHALLTTFITVASKPIEGKQIQLNGSDRALCAKIKEMANSPEFEPYKLKIIDGPVINPPPAGAATRFRPPAPVAPATPPPMPGPVV